MALSKTAVPFILRGGIQQKGDAKSTVPPALLVAENVSFVQPGELRKRNGYAQFSSVIANPPADAGSLTTGNACMAYRDELVACDATSMYSHTDATDRWTYKGPLTSVAVSTQAVVRSNQSASSQDGAVHANGLRCFAWMDQPDATVRYSVIDTNTQQVIVPPTSLYSGGTSIRPKVLVINNLFVLLFIGEDEKLHAGTLPVAEPMTAVVSVALTARDSTANSLATDSWNYDASVIETNSGPQMFIVFPNAAGSTSLWRYTATAPTTNAGKLTLAELSQVVSVFADPFTHGPVVVLWDGVSHVIRFRSYDATLAVRIATGTIETTPHAVFAITGVGVSSTVTALRIFYSINKDASGIDYYTRVAVIVGDYTVTAAGAGAGFYMNAPATGDLDGESPTDLLRSVGLAGKAFAYADTAFVPICFNDVDGGTQPTYFVADEAANIVARMFSGTAGGLAAGDAYGYPMLPESPMVDATTVLLPLLTKGPLLTDDGWTYSAAGVTAAVLDFNDVADSYGRTTLANTLHVSGSRLTSYDSVSPVEHGFNVYPTITADDAFTSGGSIATGTYSYVACYEWPDNFGQIYRSAPSNPFSVFVPGATSGSVLLGVTTLRLTAKQAPRADVSIVFYRTLVGGTRYFRTSSITAPVLNDVTVDSLTFTDTTSDATLLGNALLYTDGGVLDNDPAPPCSSLTVYRNRVVALDDTDRLTLWYSKQRAAPQPGAVAGPVEFSAYQTLAVDPAGGNVTAVQSLDDKLIVFKESRVYYFYGQGPDSTGAQNDFSDAILITTDCGCISARSIATTPSGLMFQSRKGIYLLSRDLRVSYIGADVEDYNDDTVTSAQLIPTTNQVRFTMRSGVALVYDYYLVDQEGQGQWSVWTNIRAVDSCIFEDLFTFITAAGPVRYETPGIYSDVGRPIILKIQTPWMQFANMQGFQRVYKMLVLGTYVSAHSLNIQVAYDFNPTPSQTTVITPDDVLAWGGDTTWGGGPDTVWGGVFPKYQWRIFMDRQKCEAVSMTISDVQTNADAGEGFRLSALTFEVGIKQGAYRLPAAQSSG